MVAERKPIAPAATNPAEVPSNGLEVERLARATCQRCGCTHMEVVLASGVGAQLRCTKCGAWVKTPRLR